MKRPLARAAAPHPSPVTQLRVRATGPDVPPVLLGLPTTQLWVALQLKSLCLLSSARWASPLASEHPRQPPSIIPCTRQRLRGLEYLPASPSLGTRLGSSSLPPELSLPWPTDRGLRAADQPLWPGPRNNGFIAQGSSALFVWPHGSPSQKPSEVGTLIKPMSQMRE